MEINKTAQRPPMGWNSWDCYGASVNEEQVRANAIYMAENLKQYGWKYIIVDIQWYEPAAKSFEYNENSKLAMDEYGRLIPAVNRFPTSVGNKGFKPLADFVHSLGLKFGIHILRGIPKQAIRNNTRIKNSVHTAAEIADFGSVCEWNHDMCGIDMSCEAAQDYYNSIFEMYAEWEIDFVKVDDISRPYHREEIEAINKAIENCGREIVLSLSPGAASLNEAEHLGKYANMWRMTDDFWDEWHLLKKMFDYCRDWFPYVKEGHWPDCDMIPIGAIRICNDIDNKSHFTRDEQMTLMSLWAIFRSPLFFGGDMTMNDDFTLSLLQNEDIININRYSSYGREVYRKGNEIIWAANGYNKYYVAVFNIGDTPLRSEFSLKYIGFDDEAKAREIWRGAVQQGDIIKSEVAVHGVCLYEITSI